MEARTARAPLPSVAVIVYERCSPTQVRAVEEARRLLDAEGCRLIPLELSTFVTAHDWGTSADPRGEGWRSLEGIPPHDRRGALGGLRAFRRLRGALRDLGAEVVVMNGWYDPVVWLMAAERALGLGGARLALVTDSTSADRARSPLLEAPKRALLRRVAAAFTAGAPQSRYLQALGFPAERISLGCDVVDVARFTAPGRPRIGERSVVIGTAARLAPEKNLVAAAEALGAAAATWDAEVTWRIAGEGALRDRLEGISLPGGVRIELPGRVAHDAMPDLYRGLELYWQPSLSEPWGLAVAEAMAAGLPVLVSDRCGCAEDLVHPDSGWVHPATHEGMVRGLDAAWRARERWGSMGRAAADRAGAWGLGRFAGGLRETLELAAAGRP